MYREREIVLEEIFPWVLELDDHVYLILAIVLITSFTVYNGVTSKNSHIILYRNSLYKEDNSLN